MFTTPLESDAHIATIVAAACTALTMLFTGGAFVAALWVKSRFLEWLDSFNRALDDKFVSREVYEIEHPHLPRRQVRRHAE